MIRKKAFTTIPPRRSGKLATFIGPWRNTERRTLRQPRVDKV